jgi:hypothetical protein
MRICVPLSVPRHRRGNQFCGGLLSARRSGELAGRFKESNPEVPFLLLSGAAEIPVDAKHADVFMSKLEGRNACWADGRICCCWLATLRWPLAVLCVRPELTPMTCARLSHTAFGELEQCCGQASHRDRAAVTAVTSGLPTTRE